MKLLVFLSLTLHVFRIQQHRHVVTLMDKFAHANLLRPKERGIKPSEIETVNDQLKNISEIEHSRHRSPANFLVNLISGLIAYMLKPSKPSLRKYDDSLSLSFA